MKNKENLREKQVNLRLTQAEYERLTRTAQAAPRGTAASGGRRISAWCCGARGCGRTAENQNNFFRWNLMQAVTRSRI